MTNVAGSPRYCSPVSLGSTRRRQTLHADFQKTLAQSESLRLGLERHEKLAALSKGLVVPSSREVVNSGDRRWAGRDQADEQKKELAHGFGVSR